MSQVSAGAHVEPLRPPVPIYMIGESHCMAFRDQLFRETTYFNREFIARSLFIPSITTNTFVENGQLHPKLGDVLMGEMLLTGGARGWTPENTKPTHARTVGVVDRPSLLPTSPMGVPILVFFLGEISLRAAFLKTLGKRNFDLPVAVPYLEEIPSDDEWDRTVENVSLPVVLNLLNQVVGPFLNGMLALYNIGFTNLYVHSVPPPTLNDAEFEWMNGFYTPARLRYKAAHLYNSCFASFCQQYNIGFLNIWDEATIRGALNPDFYLDGCHLEPSRSVPVTLRKLTEQLASRNRAAVQPRYEFVLQRAQASFAESGEAADGAVKSVWEARGLVVDALPEGAVDELRADLHYEAGVANRHVRLDWNGAGIDPWPNLIATAEPSLAGLCHVYELLNSQPLKRLLESCQGCALTAVSARFFRFGPGEAPESGPMAPHTDDAPPGVVRCCVYLTDAGDDAPSFEWVNGSETKQRVTGRPGTVLIFDGKTLRHQWSGSASASREVLDVVLMPLGTTATPSVIWPGMNNWPVDPCNFSVDGFLTYPEKTGQVDMRVKLDSQDLLQRRLTEPSD